MDILNSSTHERQAVQKVATQVATNVRESMRIAANPCCHRNCRESTKHRKTIKTLVKGVSQVTHIKSIMPKNPDPDAPVFSGGGTRPNNRFRTLCSLAWIEPRMSIEAGEEQRWVLKDLRKTCATYYEEHVPESSVEILGHSVGGVTYALP